MNSSSSSSQSVPTAKRLDGRIALITGGASGIGAATVRLFARHGAKVVIADVQDDLGLSLIKDMIGCAHGEEVNISYVHCDVTKESDVQTAVDTTVAKYDRLDILFSNAGIIGKSVSSILEVDHDALKQIFDVNVFGAFYCAKHAARVMIPARKGSMIFNASMATVSFGEVQHPYCSSKTATLGLAKNLGVELGEYGIRVNAVSPYFVPTALGMHGFRMDIIKAKEMALEAANLKGTVLQEEDVAEAVLFLAGDESKYVSGLNLVVDGGYSTANKQFSLAAQKFTT